jgi:exopolyphosphatase/guanosine-5'-triphosphate,3'-diphosphate pyrophosphatase
LCVQGALDLGRSYSFEEGHAVKVTSLALKLFDCLGEIHRLSQHERIMLECAGLLHDIGLTKEPKGHHKHSMDIIIEHGLSGFSPGEITMIALISRYHRKALPSLKHDRFAALSEPCRDIVMKLSALLRVADALDRTHRNAVKDVNCEVLPDTIRITCGTSGPAEEEIAFGLIKSDLMQVAFDRRVEIGN